MSVFDTTSQPVTDPTTQPSVVDQLVGEGKKFKTIEEALQGKIEADNFIEEQKAKIDSLEAQVNKDDRLDELLKQLQDKAITPVVETETTPEGTPKLEVDDLKSLVDSALKEHEKEGIRSKNLSIVEQELEKNFGTEAEAEVLKKVKELGVSKETLSTMAGESPAAFLTLMGTPPTKSSNPIVSGDVKVPDFVNSGVRDNDYYRNLRKTNKTLYYSGQVQEQMFKDRVSQGGSFYKT